LFWGKLILSLPNSIRNRTEYALWKPGCQRLLKAGMIEVTPPDKYGRERGKFIELIKATYVMIFRKMTRKE